MDQSAINIPADVLEKWTCRLFESYGISPESAAATAESLVDADLCGITTHGVVRVPIYIKRVEHNVINKNPIAKFTPVGNAAQRLDGDNGLGQWVGLQAINRACDLAGAGGIGMVLATRSNHFGTAGWFARKAAQRGFAALVWSQVESLVVPYGGTKRFFGTNPICASMPRKNKAPITLDMATSAVPLGKIEVAKVGSGVIPIDWAVDANGVPTTDPYAVHALQPMAGPKGSGLAMLIDLLTGGLAGTVCGPRIRRMYDDFDDEQNLTHTFIAINASAFAQGSTTDEVIDTMVNDLQAQKPAPNHDHVMLPGEIEDRNRKRNLDLGIAIPPALRETFVKFGEDRAVRFPA